MTQPDVRRKILVSVVTIILACEIGTQLRLYFVSHQVSHDPADDSRLAASINGTNSLALIGMKSPDDPWLKVYTLPLKSNVETNHYNLLLYDNGGLTEGYSFDWNTNNSYRMYWNTTFATYGKHSLKVRLAAPFVSVYGPEIAEYVTNLVQFDPDTGLFATQAWIYARLHFPTSDYVISICTTNNSVLKTIRGHTDKGVIDETWDLRDPNRQLRQDTDFMAYVSVSPVFTDAIHPENANLNSNTTVYPYHLLRTPR